MKRILAVICAAALMITLAACNNQTKQTTTNKAAASGAVTASSQDTASDGNTSSGQTASSKKSSVNYRHKTAKYLYEKNNKNYTVSFPELSTEAPNYQKANDLLKNTAMQTIQLIGVEKKDATTKIKVKGKLTFYNNDFISATYEEDIDISSPRQSKEAFRTVIFDLKKGTSVPTADLIVKNDALNALLLKEAKEQVSSKLKKLVTADVIKKGMGSCSVYFTKTEVGISLPVSSTLNDHIEIKTKCEDFKPYMSKSDIWSSFTAK